MNAASNQAVQIGPALRRALDSIQRWGTRSRRHSGMALTVTDVWILDYLSTNGTTGMGELARWQQVDRSTMTAQVKRLSGNGWVERVINPRDRRAVQVHLTPEGDQVIADYFVNEAAILDRLLSDWTAGDVAQLSALLTRFAAELDADPAQLPGREVTTG